MKRQRRRHHRDDAEDRRQAAAHQQDRDDVEHERADERLHQRVDQEVERTGLARPELLEARQQRGKRCQTAGYCDQILVREVDAWVMKYESGQKKT